MIMHCKCYENHILSMKMAIRIEHRIFDQILTSVSFEPKNGNPPEILNFEDNCLPNGSTGKAAVWGGGGGWFLFIQEIWRCQTKSRFV